MLDTIAASTPAPLMASATSFVSSDMAYQGKTVYTELTEAVAGLNETGRSEAIQAVTHGDIPANSNSAVRNSAIRIGKAYLRRKTDAQLKRQEWWTWLLTLVSVGLAIYFMATSSGKYEAASWVVLALLCVIGMPLGVVRQRRIQRNIALLTESATSQ